MQNYLFILKPEFDYKIETHISIISGMNPREGLNPGLKQAIIAFWEDTVL